MSGVSPRNVDGRECNIEGERKGFIVARLTVGLTRKLLRIAEESLFGLTLLASIEVVDHDDLNFALEVYSPHIGPAHLLDGLTVNTLVFLEFTHIKIVDICFAGELLRPASLSEPRIAVEILHADIITETADEIESQGLHSGGEVLFRKVGINHNENTDGQLLLAAMLKHAEMLGGKGIRAFHS
ncbi:MAG: hypothetical protein MJZ04_09970 [Bacteroidales bacterium]|nr:hypothetical protein [Bacteroidales bacterium]